MIILIMDQSSYYFIYYLTKCLVYKLSEKVKNVCYNFLKPISFTELYEIYQTFFSNQ